MQDKVYENDKEVKEVKSMELVDNIIKPWDNVFGFFQRNHMSTP